MTVTTTGKLRKREFIPYLKECILLYIAVFLAF